MNCVFEKRGYDFALCSALKEKNCEGCRFRKTPEELEAGRKKAEARIKTLPLKVQVHIKEKYKIKPERRADDERN